jgi:predicted transcriptional regulator of viral defense system
MKKSGKKLPKEFVLRSKDLEAYFGSRVAIKRSAESGALQSVGSGIYASPSLDPFIASAIAVTKFFPRAVISNRTALYFHKLSDFAVERIDVDILNDTKISNRLLHVHRVANSKLVGITKISLAGHLIKIYDLERTLCEAYRLDPAGPDFFKALKRYLKHHEPNSNKIKKYDKALGTNVLVHVMQELADG